ncbi:MAG: type II toxin-antitoxin system RelE/ParE family toxin [Methanocellales archaeon]|nr:type II toxin-antitoxin system RelE/ParE family toxin [Methanocellales archaeon]MDI6902310.1 type II toxin-antitoxin system RelE/ParE family toxin [Methanocellales archaeon]
MKKRDKALYDALVKKILLLYERPHIGRPLRHVLKGRWRIHVGHFILIYEIDEENNKMTLLEFEHHDKVYK